MKYVCDQYPNSLDIFQVFLHVHCTPMGKYCVQCTLYTVYTPIYIYGFYTILHTISTIEYVHT